MPGWDGNGNFTRAHNWQADDAADIGIVSDRHDEEDDNFAQGFNTTFCRDGQAPATGEWNLDNHQINNLGAGTEDGDAINLGQLTGSGPTGTPDFKKSINLIGADLNGRVNFRSPTGVQGIGWYGADMSWLARLKDSAVPAKFRDRLVANNKFDGTGTDVAILDDEGNLGITSLTYNLSYDPAGNWRTISPGWGARLAWGSNGRLSYQINKTATATDPYVSTILEERVGISGESGNAIMVLNKDATGDKESTIVASKGGLNRWIMQMGNAATESGTRTGSNFYINGYNNDGTYWGTPFYIMRVDGSVAIPYGISGTLTINGAILFTNYVSCIGSNPIVIGGNQCYMRPNGYASSAGESYWTTLGYLHCYGYYERSGTTGSFGSQIFNFLYVSSTDVRAYVNDQIRGYWTPPCDYRIKREVKALPRSWDAIKKLRPIQYKSIEDGDEREHWGFIAHELQEDLIETAATGHKDQEEDTIEYADDNGKSVARVTGKHMVPQGPNIMAVVAALTSALQEAQLRIEALEAKLAT